MKENKNVYDYIKKVQLPKFGNKAFYEKLKDKLSMEI